MSQTHQPVSALDWVINLRLLNLPNLNAFALSQRLKQ